MVSTIMRGEPPGTLARCLRVVIDLHTHILPGIDDGAKTLEESRAMARLAVADGIAVVAATPHASSEQPHRELAEAVAALQRELEREAIELRLVSGAEIRLSADAAERLADGTLPTLNGTRYALMELPFHLAPPNFEHYLFEVQLAGFTPVLAHVERYRWLQPAPSRLDALGERGVVLQVTAGSLRGDFGSAARRTAQYVLARSLPAILASDAHDSRFRPPELGFARKLIERHAGSRRGSDLLDRGPAAVLAGEPFPAPTAREDIAPEGREDDGRALSFANLARRLGRWWRGARG